MIKIEVTDEMVQAVHNTMSLSGDRDLNEARRAIAVTLALVERDLNLAVFGLHVDGEYWQVELENKDGFRSGAPGCIEVTE